MPDTVSGAKQWMYPLLGKELCTLDKGAAFMPRACESDGLVVKVGNKGTYQTIPYGELEAARETLFRSGELIAKELKTRASSYIVAILAYAFAADVTKYPLTIFLEGTYPPGGGRQLHPRDLERILELQRQLGDEAEAVVFRSEVDRLKAAGRSDLAERVDHVSLNDCAAGFDIRSCDLEGEEIYIEVKGSRGNQIKFEISENELKMAEMRGTRYYLYMVLNVGRKGQRIESICDLHHTIQTGEILMRPTSMRAEYVG